MQKTFLSYYRNSWVFSVSIHMIPMTQKIKVQYPYIIYIIFSSIPCYKAFFITNKGQSARKPG